MKIAYSTIYRVEVVVPNAVWERFGHTHEYALFSYEASSKLAASGCNTYDEVIEWGESAVREQVEQFAKAWQEQIARWEAQMGK